MDAKLCWKAHIDEIQRKATKSIAALRCLGNSLWGIGLKDMRKIFREVVIPQIMYACSAWSNSNYCTQSASYTQRTLETLQQLQARALRTVTGAFRAALDIEAHALPMAQQIWKHNIEALARIGPSSYQQRGQRLSPQQSMQRMLQEGNGPDISAQEQPLPYTAPPWWQGPETYIEETAEKAQSSHEKSLAARNAIRIYTDGSGINGQVAAERGDSGPGARAS